MPALDQEFPFPFLAESGLRVGQADKTTSLNPDLHSPAPADIRALTAGVQAGDGDCFSRLYDLYSHRVYRFLLVISRGDGSAAREVCQSAMIKVAQRCKTFPDERAFWAWLCALARNSLVDYYRERNRRGEFISLDALPLEEAAPDQAVLQLSEMLVDALASFPADERELLQAAYVDRRPLQEVADAAGLTYKALESRLARLRHKLKEQLLRELRHENQTRIPR